MMDADVIVVGGGVIGTAIAWRAAVAGRTVTLIDPGTDDKASLVAAGMLGPVSESVFGERDLLNLNLHAIERFPSFNRELEAATGLVPGSVPPFGRPILPFDLYLDAAIPENDRIAFNAGSLTDSIVMGIDDYRRLANPEVFSFAAL